MVSRMEKNAWTWVVGVVLAAGAVCSQEAMPVQTNSPSVEQMNEVFGLQLWADTNLWADGIKETAGRLGGRLESKTSTETSYLIQPAAVLGIKPEKMKLLGKAGTVDSVLIMFANKGDTLGFKPNPDNFLSSKEYNRILNEYTERERQLPKTIKEQSDRIESRLKTLLGNCGKQRFGEGDKTREWVKTWQWGCHAILLSEQKDASLSLRIVPLGLAENRGQTERVPDREIRAEVRARVFHRENGDVIVTQIPMIDQGRKGYCVPSTWARYLQYMGIQADEYVLANAAQTKKGGGTQSDRMMDAVTGIVKQNRRAIKTLRAAVTLYLVSKYIDEGLPLMWDMHSVGPFEGFGNSADRMGEQSPEMWKKALKADRKEARQIKIPPHSGHTCMIIGYNPKTDEIATSDSWGLRHAEKWYTIEEVQAVSEDRLYVITW